VISHKHKFIYTKVTKTGSSSIEETLITSDPEAQNLNHYHLLDDIDERTKDYFKFTFVRNPWARCVSHFFYKIQVKGHEAYRDSDFREFITSARPPYSDDDDRRFALLHLVDWCEYSPNLHRIMTELYPFENQLDWISDEQGNVLLDFIGRVENFQDDFDTVCDRIGIPRQQLPHVNKTDHRHYTDYYDDETIQIVAEIYARDIEYFGYEFGGGI
jgi:hypothetical protein